jgi:hypothetical protein
MKQARMVFFFSLCLLSCSVRSVAQTSQSDSGSYVIRETWRRGFTGIFLLRDTVRASRVVQFTAIGQKDTIHSGEVIQILFKGIDWLHAALHTLDDSVAGTTIFEILNKDSVRVRLTSDTRQVYVDGTSWIPEIVIDHSLKPDIIDISPQFDETHKHIGYLIRYGKPRSLTHRIPKSSEKPPEERYFDTPPPH